MNYGPIMPIGGSDYPSEAKQAIAPTLKERLGIAVINAEEQLKVAKEARDILDKNPELERLIDLLQRGRF